MIRPTAGPWRRGNFGQAVVADTPVTGGALGGDNIEAYGGHLIAESIAPCNLPAIIATPALLEAVTYVLDRVQDNPDVGYYLGWGTQMFYLLVRAEAAALEIPLEQHEKARRRDLQPSYRRREPRVVTLEEERDHARHTCERYGINWAEESAR